MQEPLDSELIVGTRLEARDAARQLQSAGYGLEESTDLDGGYEFAFARPDDGATSTILLIPTTINEHPNFIVMRRRPELPFWKRGGSDVSFLSPDEARDYWVYNLDGASGFEIKPHIDVFSRE